MGRSIGAVGLVAYHASLLLMFAGPALTVRVCPGDLVIGDADGVVTIPAADAAALLPRVKAHAAREAKTRAGNASGTTDPERFNASLRAKGCPV